MKFEDQEIDYAVHMYLDDGSKQFVGAMTPREFHNSMTGIIGKLVLHPIYDVHYIESSYNGTVLGNNLSHKYMQKCYVATVTSPEGKKTFTFTPMH